MGSQEKYKSNMESEKYKARVIARGFTQTKDVDFNETSSSTARSASSKIIMALATLNKWYVLQADFIATYLAGDLKESIFMEQSGAFWQEEIKGILGRMSYTPLISDNAIDQSIESKIIVASYLDDFLIIGPSRDDIYFLTNNINKKIQ